MYEELINVILSEKEALNKLLSLLDNQYSFILKKDIFGLDDVANKIQACNKEIAEEEVKRRKLVKSNSMKDVVFSSGNERLEESYRDILKLLEAVRLQKDTNDLLLKQQLSYTNQMLNYINPNREMKTYNSYGKMSR
ncbi:flagellar protein FlgN [Clostridium folliculivorans]|uniref:Flagellar protein FlgN n=1 Tax=Clostridium folliculivorans TaxID=2886038 RepID=A0A9W6D9A1_9CLOT|nr:flagellar protein FlgN [Clostridium folliculivorans]GKU23552.1 flagellar protein FlgN [Clostridium folliculivorans]GKU29668.1 flagellar protein FlgN [Clostridium folliculivorans]